MPLAADRARRCSVAPPPRAAVNSSSVAGTYTAPTSVPALGRGGDRHAVAGQPVEEVGRAVDRVDQPADAAGAGGRRALLADDRRRRGGRRAAAPTISRSDGAVVLGDHVGGGRLRVDACSTPSRRAVADHRARPRGRGRRRGRSSSARSSIASRAHPGVRRRGARGRSMLLPLADGAQHEHGDDAHPAGGERRRRTSAPRPAADVAVAVALQLDQRVADQPAGEAADEDGDERQRPGAGEGSADSGRSPSGSARAIDGRRTTRHA